MDRRTLGSWLQGPRAAGPAGSAAAPRAGERLGLPPTGPGAAAGFGRRLWAIVVDWALCLLIAGGLLHGGGFVTLGVFAVENAVLVGTLGTTVGQRLLQIRVVRLDGQPPGLLAAAVRTGLLCLGVPALIWDRDGRGLHDKAAGTVVVRT